MTKLSHTPGPRKISYSSIRKAITPLSKALISGENPAPIMIGGYQLTAERQRNLHVRFGGGGGFAWNVLITATKNGRNISGSPDEIATAIMYNITKATGEQ